MALALGPLCSVFFLLVAVGSLHGALAQVPITAQYYNGPVRSSSSNYGDWTPGSGCGNLENIPSGFGGAVWASTGIAFQNWHAGAVCGMCVLVTSVEDQSPYVPNRFPKPPFYAIVTNTGYDALTDYWLDFFQQPVVPGNWWLTWQAVDCPVGNHSVQYQVWSNSGYYFKMVPLYAKRLVHRMCIFVAPYGGLSSWVELGRNTDGTFYFNAGSQYEPVSVPRIKVISVDGQVFEDVINVNLANGGTYSQWGVYGGYSNANFPPITGPITGPPPSC